MKKWDVIVIGGGPAGSTAARFCAEKCLDVLLIDSEDFPRKKPCGGGLSLSAIKELEMSIPDNIIERICYGMRSIYKGKGIEISDKIPAAYMVKREKFDNFLLLKAKSSGITFKNCTCKEVKEHKDKITVHTDTGTFDTEICIGADGYFSKTAKAVRKPLSPDEKRFCLICHIPLSESKITKIMGNYVELDYGYINMGYAWLFPKSNCISAGIGGACSNGKQLKRDLKIFLAQHKLSTDLPFTGCFIPISNLKNPISTKRIMLIGDAAGFVDSFSGEGIKNAIISGKIAAETANKALVNRNKVSVLSYRRNIYSLIANDLRWALRITKVAFKHEKLFFGTLLFDRKVLTKYFSVMRGDLSYIKFVVFTAVRFPLILIRNLIKN